MTDFLKALFLSLMIGGFLRCPPPTGPNFVRADERGTIVVTTPTGEQRGVTGLPPCFQVEVNKLFTKAAEHTPTGGAHTDGLRNSKKHCEGAPVCFHIQSDTHKPRKKARRAQRRTAPTR